VIFQCDFEFEKLGSIHDFFKLNCKYLSLSFSGNGKKLTAVMMVCDANLNSCDNKNWIKVIKVCYVLFNFHLSILVT